MANRINLGDGYETDDGETKHRFWLDVSSALMDEVTARAIEEGDNPREALASFVAGEAELDDPEPPQTTGGRETAESDD